MDSLGDGISSLKKTQTSYIVGNSSGSTTGYASLTPPQPEKDKIPSSEYSTVINQNGSLTNLKHTNNGKLQYLGLCDIGESSSHNPVSGFESKCCIKHLVDDSEACDSSSSIGPKDFGLNQCGVDVQLNSPLAPQSASTYCPSPPNSFYSATKYTEAKESFNITEASECQSIMEKSDETVEVSQSYDFVDSRKVSSTSRASTGSDLSDESSSSSLNSVMYKPHKGNDVRWIAICKARSHYGVLQLNHFRLLKQLGCGDIGKVYLSELVGTRTYFAMTVMNKAALESRKKLLRTQTEREILQSLDHRSCQLCIHTSKHRIILVW